MKASLAICLIVAAVTAWAGDKPAAVPPAGAVVKGTVLEVKEVESYTYLRLKTKDGETWAAVAKAPVRKDAEVTLENVMVMNNFESKALQKTFPTILFATLGGASAAGKDTAADAADVQVPKASGGNAYTVAEILTTGAKLKDKPVLVRGKIVKYNSGIMGKNWIHLRDGSGSADKGTNDILVTTTSQAQAGEIVTVKGVVRTDKDFGAGYAYKVLIEEAALQR